MRKWIGHQRDMYRQMMALLQYIQTQRNVLGGNEIISLIDSKYMVIHRDDIVTLSQHKEAPTIKVDLILEDLAFNLNSRFGTLNGQVLIYDRKSTSVRFSMLEKIKNRFGIYKLTYASAQEILERTLP